jgi:hypothetical protein
MASAAVARVPAALAGGLFEVGDAPVGGRELLFDGVSQGKPETGNEMILRWFLAGEGVLVASGLT